MFFLKFTTSIDALLPKRKILFGHVDMLAASENTLHDVTVLRIHSAIFWSDALRMKHFQS